MFATRFFILWNTVLLVVFVLVTFSSFLFFDLYRGAFPNIADSKSLINLAVIFGAPLFNLALAFPITFYFFQRSYPRLAGAVSPELPTTIPQREMWKSWAICYPVVPVAAIGMIVGAVLIAKFTGRYLNHRGIGVTVYPMALFLISLSVYLRLKYLAGNLKA